MRRIINSLSFFLVLGFLLFLDVPLSSAAKIEGLPPPKQPYLPDTTVEAFDYLKGSVFPHESSDIITENTGTVKITFDGLVSGESYKLCLGGLCTAQFHGDISESKIVGAPPTKDVGDDAQIEVKVCADGRQRLKIYDEGEGDCKDEDYFHGRQIYAALLLDEDNIVVDSGVFFVSMYYPKVTLPETFTPKDNLVVEIKGTKRPHDSRKRNNYAIELFKADSPGNIIEDDCFQIEEGETEVKDYGKKEEGDWLIKINDQANEGGWGRSGCSAEFTYYHIYVQVRKDPSKCTLRSPVLGTKRCYEIRPDPNRSDLKGAEKTIKAPLPPCASVFTKEDGCLAVKTGLGIDISTNPADFIQDVYGIILGISGGIALVLIIFSGYQMTTSRGVPEKLEAAREQLVSAIIGLIFIIIALAVIQIIGIDILRIPGFSR